MKNSYGCTSQKPFCFCQESSASNCRAGVVGPSQKNLLSTHSQTHTHWANGRMLSDKALFGDQKWCEIRVNETTASLTTGCCPELADSLLAHITEIPIKLGLSCELLCYSMLHCHTVHTLLVSVCESLVLEIHGSEFFFFLSISTPNWHIMNAKAHLVKQHVL